MEMGGAIPPFTNMVKVRMLDKGMNTTKFGFLAGGSTVEVPGHFADWLVRSGYAKKPPKSPPKKKSD